MYHDDWPGHPTTEMPKYDGDTFHDEYRYMRCDNKGHLSVEYPLGKPKRPFDVNIVVVKTTAYLTAIISLLTLNVGLSTFHKMCAQ